MVESKAMFGFGKKPPPASASASPLHSADEKQDSNSARRTSSEPNLNFDDMSVQELEDYAVNQSQETTKTVNNCLKIAEDIRQDGARTLETLHQQGEQIHRTHEMAVDMDRDLSKVCIPLHLCCKVNSSMI